MPGVFSCACKCNCGACTRKTCGCECHDLDPLNDHELMDVIIREGGKMVSDVYGKNRNQLMQLIVQECSDPMRILRAGVKVIQTRLKKASKKRENGSSRLELLKRVAERGDAAGIARILALDNDKKKKTIIRRGPVKHLVPPPTKPASKPARAPRKPTKPTRKPAKPARRCATS